MQARWLWALALAALVGCSSGSAGDDDAADAGAEVGDTAPDAAADTDPPDSDAGFDAAPDTEDDADADADPSDVGCRVNADCDDDNVCSQDICIGGVCDNTRGADDPPDEVDGDCQRQTCNGTSLELVADVRDTPPDDGIGCTIEACVGGTPMVTPDDSLCSDGDRCNGIDICGEMGCETIPGAIDPDADTDGDGVRDCEDVEDCDGIDNDGDGTIDNNLEVEDIGEPCYSGPSGTEGVGTCAAGLLQCAGGALVCSDEVLPEPDERCDGRDNDCDGTVPADEAAAGCSADFTVGPDRAPLTLEMRTAVREVDVLFHTDSTGSMTGVINTIRTNLVESIVPGIERSIPNVAYGVSTFEDFPIGSFGTSDNEPFLLYQRITSEVRQVLAAIEDIVTGGGRGGTSGVESLYHICTGEGIQWPTYFDTSDSRVCVPFGRVGVAGELDGSDHWYSVDVEAGDSVLIETFGDCAEGADTMVTVFDEATGMELAEDRESGFSDDVRISFAADAPGTLLIQVEGEGSAGRGWYLFSASVAGTPLLPATGVCTTDAAGTSIDTPIALFDAEIVGSTYALADCRTDCGSTTAPADWVDSFCLGGFDDRFEADVCGNGVVEDGEDCDDANAEAADGCDDCVFELDGVAPFDPDFEYNPAFGHGERGGVGFRNDALPIVLHFTDTQSRTAEEYLEYSDDFPAHTAEDIFDECDKLGLRVIGVANSSSIPDAPIDDPYDLPGLAWSTGAAVPTCAFDGTDVRVDGTCGDDECCTGLEGAGRAPTDDGLCPLVFQIESGGGGLTDAVVAAIETLSQFAPFRFTPVLQNHPDNTEDAVCLIKQIEVVQVTPPGSCNFDAFTADGDGDGYEETVLDGAPGSRILYEMELSNTDVLDHDRDGDILEPCVSPGTYQVIVIVESNGGVEVDREVLTLTVTE